MLLFKTDLVNIVIEFVVIFEATFALDEKGCHLNVVNESTEKFLPVPLYNFTTHYELVVPQRGVINLKQGDKITLLCVGPKNYITLTNSNITTISCIQKNTVQTFNIKTDFDDVMCKKTSKGQILKTQEKCGNDAGQLYKIGYQVTKKDWVTMIDVCHVPETGNTLYTQHTIHGKAMKYASKATYRPGFSTSGLNDEVTASLAYTKPSQKSTFNKILKSARLADNYINGKSYLARGHLAPHADFLLASSQYSSYYYINTAPQWQKVNGGSWKSIESTVRKLSETYEELQIITGTHDILKYKDLSGIPEPIFLVLGQKLPVPKYFWKIVYDPDSQRAIMFVILNDPYTQKIKESDIFCEDVCSDNGYTNSTWGRIDTGYVFCCEVNTVENVIKHMPKLIATGILRI